MTEEVLQKPFPLLRLPREIRDAILGEVFFPGEREPKDYAQNNVGLATTAVRQIFPYRVTQNRTNKFQVAILRTCHQLQEEGEAILYGTSSWNLMYEDWDDTVKLSYEFFENLPKRLRRLIHRVERKCYSEPYAYTISLHDWEIFMTFLARECPNLYSLKLWGPGDRYEGPQWVRTCQKHKKWVKAILQIDSLLEFDVPVIHGGVIYNYPDFKGDFLPWLKLRLLQKPKAATSVMAASHQNEINESGRFRFLDLRQEIRDKVYRYALLPPDLGIHPYLKSWYDKTTQNIIPLFLTCKQIHKESESVLYREGVFTALTLKYQVQLLRMLRGDIYDYANHISPYRGPTFSRAQRLRVRHMRICLERGRSVRGPLITFAAGHMLLHDLEVKLSNQLVNLMNVDWNANAPNSIPNWRGGFRAALLRNVARVPLRVKTSSRVALDPACLEWLTKRLKEERMFRIDESHSIDWLYESDDVSSTFDDLERVHPFAEDARTRYTRWEHSEDDDSDLLLS
ncbi:hypothetical protein MMC13_004643 [Lambiella insularis]|nr:hypothetical protein [Lambiella insularis]